MKTKAEMDAKIRQLSIELAMEDGEIAWEGKYCSPFAAIEARAAEIGDMIACEIAVQRARMVNESRLPESQCDCPKCKQPGDLKRIRKRECQTIRGTIEMPEPEYYCKKCRGSFFSSDSLDRG